MTDYDLCLVWNGEHDVDFGLLESVCRTRDASLLGATPDVLDATVEALWEEQIHCRVLFNRASDADTRFLKLVD